MIRAAKLLLLLPLAPFAAGQAIPAAKGPAFYTGFRLPDVSGTLRYSLSVSERIHLGASNAGYSGDTTNFSGNVAYLSSSTVHPFSMVYSAGYLLNNSGSSYPSEVIQSLSLSQVLSLRQFHFVISDSVSYLPETPSGGLSGIPGLGDLNVPPVTESGQDILTDYAQRVSNRVAASVSHPITGRTSISASGSQMIIRYIDVPAGSAIDSDDYTGNLTLHHQFDARTTAGLSYAYSYFTYDVVDYDITTQSVMFQFSRSLSRRASFNASIGPQHIVSSDSTLVPARTNVGGSASFSYITRVLDSTISFNQGTSAGSGLVAGSENTSVHGSVSRQFGHAWHTAASVGFLKTDSLQTGAYASKSFIFGVQANRSLTRSLSAFASYSAQHQLNSGSNIPTLALNGLNQYLSFGVTFSPEAFHLGH